MPVLTVVGGPNGSGKSSIIRGLEFEGRNDLLEADAIAKRIDPADPRRAGLAAAREVIRRTRGYLENQQSFALETTLSGRGIFISMRLAKAQGFVVRLVYVCLDNPERNIQRVLERVAQGGHSVPDADVRRRYTRSLLNLPAALRLAHQAVVYDNSEAEPRKVMETQAGTVVWRVPSAPVWLRGVLDTISS